MATNAKIKLKSKKAISAYLVEELLKGRQAQELYAERYSTNAVANANKKVARIMKIQEEAINLAKE